LPKVDLVFGGFPPLTPHYSNVFGRSRVTLHSMPPSAFHEILVALFRDRPALAPELLRPLLLTALPTGSLRVTEATFTQIAPAEFAADLVILVGDPPQLGIILEVQLRRDELKRFSWPLYACALRARWRCPALVLVLAPDPAVAAWAMEDMVLGPGAGVFHAHVVSPTVIPRLTSPQAARDAPELAVLSALAHGEGPEGQQVLGAMLAGLVVLPDDAARLYYDLVTSRLTVATRRALEDAMNRGGYEYQGEFARKYVAEGVAQGVAQGKAQEACRLVLRQLARRLGLLGEPLQARIEALELEQFEALAEALLDFDAIVQLEEWLVINTLV
jgi:hypothetical protein